MRNGFRAPLAAVLALALAPLAAHAVTTTSGTTTTTTSSGRTGGGSIVPMSATPIPGTVTVQSGLETAVSSPPAPTTGTTTTSSTTTSSTPTTSGTTTSSTAGGTSSTSATPTGAELGLSPGQTSSGTAAGNSASAIPFGSDTLGVNAASQAATPSTVLPGNLGVVGVVGPMDTSGGYAAGGVSVNGERTGASSVTPSAPATAVATPLLDSATRNAEARTLRQRATGQQPRIIGIAPRTDNDRTDQMPDDPVIRY